MIVSSSILRSIAIFFFFALCAYSTFYFSYKYGSPEVSGQIDYFEYYKLYKDLDVANVDSPTNMRLIGSSIVFLITKLELSYDIDICYNVDTAEKRIYLAAILASYLAAVLTCWMIFQIVFQRTKNGLASIIAGLLYLVQYGTIFWGTGGMIDTFSILMFTVAFSFYEKKSYWLFLVLALSILQREIILIAFGVLAFINFFIDKDQTSRRYFLKAFVTAIVCFVIHVILRETVFYSPRWSGYTDVSFYQKIFDFSDVSLGEYIRGTFLSQNILIIYLGLLGYKKYVGESINRNSLYLIVGVFLAFNMMCFLLHVLPQAGRYFYLTSPMILVYLGYELSNSSISYLNTKKSVI